MSRRVNVQVLDVLLPYNMEARIKEFRLYYRFNHFGITQFAGKISREKQHKKFSTFTMNSYCLSKAKIDILLKCKETFYREVTLGRISIPLKWVQPDTITDGWFPLKSMIIKDPFLIRVQIHIPTLSTTHIFESANHASFDIESRTWEQDFINLQPQAQYNIIDEKELENDLVHSTGDNYSLAYSSDEPIFLKSCEYNISREI